MRVRGAGVVGRAGRVRVAVADPLDPATRSTAADPIDHALFAGFVLGRVGTWWAFAGLFAISATLKDPNGTGAYLQGRAFADTFRDQYSWYLLVLIAFPVLQFLSGYFLGRRRPS